MQRPSTVASTPLDIKYAVLKYEEPKKRRDIQIPDMSKKPLKTSANIESSKLLSIAEILNKYKSPNKDERQ